MKYAVMICLDGNDDWIFVTEDSKGNCWDLRPVLFETSELAEEAANIWRLKGKERMVKVVTYNN